MDELRVYSDLLCYNSAFSLLKIFFGAQLAVFFNYQSPCIMHGAVGLFVFTSSLRLPQGKYDILLGLSLFVFTIYVIYSLLLDILAGENWRE